MIKERTSRPRAKLKATPLSNVETRPWKCPHATCGIRYKRLCGLKKHWEKRLASLDFPQDVKPTAGPGKILEKVKIKKKKMKKKEALKMGRKQGQQASSRVRDIDVMRDGVHKYEKVLAEGETSEEYKERTGISRSKIFHWRSKIKKANKTD